MKSGDDLRQDQVVLGMLECFNRVWAREGVTHRLNGGGQTPVRAPLYRCLACGTDRGFVEMLGGAKPIEDLVEKRSRGENGWKSGALAATMRPFFAAHLCSLSHCRRLSHAVCPGDEIIPTAGTCLPPASSPLTSCFSSRFVTTDCTHWLTGFSRWLHFDLGTGPTRPAQGKHGSAGDRAWSAVRKRASESTTILFQHIPKLCTV